MPLQSLRARDDTPGITLIISQVYLPDPAAAGQYLAEVASRLVLRGNRVRVLTANRGYDNPSRQYEAQEQLDGVNVERLPLSSFGKRSLSTRLVGAAAFLAQVVWRGVMMPELARVVVSTSPPMASLAALAIGKIRGVPISYWVMDINPDQAILLGKVTAGSLPDRLLEILNRAILSRAESVVTLDRFMASRLSKKAPSLDRSRLAVVPMWPLAKLTTIPHLENPFRTKHGLQGKRVVMYSGNHSIASPLTTLLEAARRLKDEPRLVFAFVGGGLGKADVERYIAEHELPNTLSLPYQPLNELSQSLSAADVHVVTLGQQMVGCIHPCKVYGAMAVARPILFIGPSPSHIADLLDRHQIGWQLRHGDVDQAVAYLREIAELTDDAIAVKGTEAHRAVESEFEPKQLCGQICDLIETPREVS